MFIYGSILIAVTFSPVVFKSNPVDEAKKIISLFGKENENLVPMTPFPIPLTTPPETSMNLVMVGQVSLRKEKSGGLCGGGLDVATSNFAGSRQARPKLSIATSLVTSLT